MRRRKRIAVQRHSERPTSAWAGVLPGNARYGVRSSKGTLLATARTLVEAWQSATLHTGSTIVNKKGKVYE